MPGDSKIGRIPFEQGKMVCIAFFRPFPTKRFSSADFKQGNPFNFVGSNGGMIDLRNVQECPVACRPKAHKDWLLC